MYFVEMDQEGGRGKGENQAAPTTTPTPEPPSSPEPEPTAEPETTSGASCPREAQISSCALQGGIYECTRCLDGHFGEVCCSCQGGASSSTTTTTILTTTTTTGKSAGCKVGVLATPSRRRRSASGMDVRGVRIAVCGGFGATPLHQQPSWSRRATFPERRGGCFLCAGQPVP